MSKHSGTRRGATSGQYALVVGLVGVLAMLAITRVGANMTVLMSRTANTMLNAAGGTTGSTPTTPAAPAPAAYLAVITDTALLNTLQTQTGDPATWTLCYQVAQGTNFVVANMVAGCSGASQLLEVSAGAGNFYGGYISAPWSSYYNLSWVYPTGFFFTSAGGRGGNTYDYRCATPGNGQARVLVSTTIYAWINMYISNNQNSFSHFASNGEWGSSGLCSPLFNMRDGTTADGLPGQAALYFYRR